MSFTGVLRMATSTGPGDDTIADFAAHNLNILVAIGIVASLYPVAVALKIQPVQAIQTE